MIVKNEATLILRCLSSVLPLVDYVCISDTGSTDGTQKIIGDFLESHIIRAKIHDDRWRDFATNRNLALAHLQKMTVDYAFVIDADDTLEISAGFDIAAFKAGMDRDIYDLQVEHGGVLHPRPQIFRNKPGYYWVGVLHEYLESPKPFTRATAPGLRIKASIEGSRNADPQKFQKDAEVLKKALRSEKDAYLRARYTFYLAQSYRDCEDYENALKYYLICSKMGFWDQQVYVSLLEAIRCYEKLEKSGPLDAALDCFERAAKALPGRAEAHHAMSFLCRQRGANKQGMEIAGRGLHITEPEGLFIQSWIYDYGLQDEYSVNAYWAGQYLESLRSSLLLLASPKTPHDMVKRLAGNSIAAVEKMTTTPTSNALDLPNARNVESSSATPSRFQFS